MKKLALMGLVAALLFAPAVLANPHGEDSKGLWQINATPKKKATGTVKSNTKSNKSSATKGTPVPRYHLENAWPAK